MDTAPLDPPDDTSLWDRLPFDVRCLLFRQYLTVADKLSLTWPPPLSTFLATRSAWLTDPQYAYYQGFTRLVPPGWYQAPRPLSPHRYLVRYDPDQVTVHIRYFFLATPVDPPTLYPRWSLHGWHAPSSSSSSSSSLLDLLAAFRRRVVPVETPEEVTVYHWLWHGNFTLHRSRRWLRWLDGRRYRPAPSPASRPQVYDVPLPTREDSACPICSSFYSSGHRSVPVVLTLDPRDQSVVVRHDVDPTVWIERGTREACLTPLVLQVEEEEAGTLRAKGMPLYGWRNGRLWRSSEWVVSAGDRATAIHYDRYGTQLEQCPLQSLFEIPEEGLHEEKGIMNIRESHQWLGLDRWEIPFVLKEPPPLKRHPPPPLSVEKKLKKD